MKQQQMERALKSRHIMMITIGGTIGAGIFKGSGSSIGVAGPGVIFSYLIGGIILFIVMKSMAEIAVSNPDSRTLGDLVKPILGPHIAYTLGWIYWLNWVLVMTAEMTAAASFLQLWLPQIPLWVLAFSLSIIITLLNLLPVKVYGETEYWLASIKIVTLTLFVLFGGLILFTRYTRLEVTNHLINHGGFFPHGISGILSAMLVVMFSFGGIEMIGMTLGETNDPNKTLPRVARGVILRILLFYILPILVIVGIVPWDTLGSVQSPFITVFQAIGVPYVADIMNFILLTAVLSAVNTGMYATSRMIYNQALERNAPKMFASISKAKVPVRALIFSTAFLYIGVIFAYFAKGKTFEYLMVFPGYTVIVVWALLVLARMKSKGMTISTIVAFAIILAIFAGVIATTEVYGTMISLLVVLTIFISYYVMPNRKKSPKLS